MSERGSGEYAGGQQLGQSQLGFSAATHVALESEAFRDAPVGTKFRITEQWVEITQPRQSPWHITYSVVVQPM